MLQVLIALAQEIEIARVEVNGSRFEKQIFFDAVAINHADRPMKDVEIEVEIFDADKKSLGRLPKWTAKEIPPRRGVTVQIRDKEVQRFESYEITASYTLDERKTFKDPKPPERKYDELAIGVSGIRTFLGKFEKKTYTGDTVFLRLRIETETRPEGTLEIKVEYDKKSMGTVKRIVSAAHYKQAASKIPEQNPDVKIIAWDADAKELLVGLFRVPEQAAAEKLKLDVTFTAGKKKWTWDDLGPPFLELPK